MCPIDYTLIASNAVDIASNTTLLASSILQYDRLGGSRALILAVRASENALLEARKAVAVAMIVATMPSVAQNSSAEDIVNSVFEIFSPFQEK